MTDEEMQLWMEEQLAVSEEKAADANKELLRELKTICHEFKGEDTNMFKMRKKEKIDEKHSLHNWAKDSDAPLPYFKQKDQAVEKAEDDNKEGVNAHSSNGKKNLLFVYGEKTDDMDLAKNTLIFVKTKTEEELEDESENSWNLVKLNECNELNIGDKIRYCYFALHNNTAWFEYRPELKREANAVVVAINKTNQKGKSRRRWDGVYQRWEKERYVIVVKQIGEAKCITETKEEEEKEEEEEEEKEKEKGPLSLPKSNVKATTNSELKQEDIDQDQVLFRIESANPSKLFKVVVSPDSEMLASILMSVNSTLNWLVAFEIASFLAEHFQRSVYFNCDVFNRLLEQQFERLGLEQQQHGVTWANLNFDNADTCFRQKIKSFPFRTHLAFPKQEKAHKLYSGLPYLPLIKRKDRVRELLLLFFFF
ncbi:myosin heavy chain [Reticulomyxa filosa]|uniref:Myosin heavy chain n=1 Tax=Reticulomyxa filosa TaxID=46433 RepID=X6M9I8_RETFI|nr:myosin heavy chain [Reticulomyxa filosa]|eukprot:ETO09680.1 myosin heavy chain [Reticulomyxa filosa]